MEPKCCPASTCIFRFLINKVRNILAEKILIYWNRLLYWVLVDLVVVLQVSLLNMWYCWIFYAINCYLCFFFHFATLIGFDLIQDVLHWGCFTTNTLILHRAQDFNLFLFDIIGVRRFMRINSIHYSYTFSRMVIRWRWWNEKANMWLVMIIFCNGH